MNETLFGKYILKINRQNKFIQEIKIFVEFERYECANAAYIDAPMGNTSSSMVNEGLCG